MNNSEAARATERELVQKIIAKTGDDTFRISGMPGSNGGLSYFGEWRSRGEEHRIGGESVLDVLRAILATEENRPAAAP